MTHPSAKVIGIDVTDDELYMASCLIIETSDNPCNCDFCRTMNEVLSNIPLLDGMEPMRKRPIIVGPPTIRSWN